MKTRRRARQSARQMDRGENMAVPKDEDILSIRTALYFYSIIVFSFILPVAVAVCLVFTTLAVKIILSILFVSLLGGLWYTYRRIAAQLRKLQSSLEPLSLGEADSRISLPGELIEVKIEPQRPALQPRQTPSAEETEQTALEEPSKQ